MAKKKVIKDKSEPKQTSGMVSCEGRKRHNDASEESISKRLRKKMDGQTLDKTGEITTSVPQRLLMYSGFRPLQFLHTLCRFNSKLIKLQLLPINLHSNRKRKSLICISIQIHVNEYTFVSFQIVVRCILFAVGILEMCQEPLGLVHLWQNGLIGHICC